MSLACAATVSPEQHINYRTGAVDRRPRALQACDAAAILAYLTSEHGYARLRSHQVIDKR
jgi:hypothetical protein